MDIIFLVIVLILSFNVIVSSCIALKYTNLNDFKFKRLYIKWIKSLKTVMQSKDMR